VDQSGSEFSSFLGRFYQGDVFPYRTISDIDPPGVNRIFVSFNFYEIDGKIQISYISILINLHISSDQFHLVHFRLGWQR
jgi:hypothetical protein